MIKLNNIRYQHAARIALAVALSMTVTQLLHLNEVYWAGISAAVVASFNEVGHVASKAKQRIAGTVCGCVLWGIISFFFPSYGAVYLLTLILVATLAFTNSKLDLRHSYFWLYGAITFLLFSTPMGLPNDTIVQLHIARMYEIIIGSVIGLATHWLSFSYRASKELDELWEEYQNQFGEFVWKLYSDLKTKNYTHQSQLLFEVSNILASTKKLEAKIASAQMERKNARYIEKIRLCRQIEHYLYSINHLISGLKENKPQTDTTTREQTNNKERDLVVKFVDTVFNHSSELSERRITRISQYVVKHLLTQDEYVEQFWHQSLGFIQNIAKAIEPSKPYQRQWTKQVTRFEYFNALRWTLIVVSLPLFWLFLGYQPNVQLAITSLLVLMFYESNAMHKGKQRLQGAAVGFLLAVPALAIISGNPIIYFIVILAVSFALEVTFFAAKHNYIALQGVICFVVGIGSDSHLDASVSRVVGIFFGLVITYLIVRWIWPKNLQREKEVLVAQSQFSLQQYIKAIKDSRIHSYLFGQDRTFNSYWHWQIEHDLNQLKTVDVNKASEYLNIYNKLSHDAFLHSSPMPGHQLDKHDVLQQLRNIYEIEQRLLNV
ncbi:FUSC family protein [Vibrio sp. S4M6]|uniref:FUSC family protein n=1 Tax=Vibrio sinus TaxID=2946865 RepID=UPI00202A2CC9|nr:FUSC family protein [Vibrio sinus]MCL9780229.1 FUSC family protein [Vibrio sinus]